MSVLDNVDTIVFLMLENRSFDHVLGHMSLPGSGARAVVNGLSSPLSQAAYRNRYQGETYSPFLMRDGLLSVDLPHTRDEIERQLGWNEAQGRYLMNGFAREYFQHQTLTDTTTPDPLGILTAEDVPITRFLADEFAVCDQWHASLPTSTQPNRIMSLCGATRVDETKGIFPPVDQMVFDWLDQRQVRWRVYHAGISFFALLGRLEIFGPNFRRVERLAPDVANEQPGDFPSVIFIEPSYADAPQIGGTVPNDNHPPLPMAPGEALLLRIYEALTGNPARWARTLWIITYDEHGGFFDHVAPPPIPFVPGPNAVFTRPFATLGVRVPSLIVSPLVERGVPYHGLLDHTSFLQLLADKFDPADGFNARVQERKQAGIRSVTDTISRSVPRTDIPVLPEVDLTATLGLTAPRTPATGAMQRGFEDAARRMVQDYPMRTAQVYPEVSHWVLNHPTS